jgi:hypothetical protein
MCAQEEPEVTHKHALAIGAASGLFGVVLSLLGGDEWFQLGLIGFGAVATTVVIYRDLLRQVWFKTFVAAMVLLQLGLGLLLPAHLERTEFKLLATADVIAVLCLAAALRKLMSRRP